MTEKGKAARGRKDVAGKKGGPASVARVEQKRAGKKGAAKKSTPKLAKQETGKRGTGGDSSGGLH